MDFIKNFFKDDDAIIGLCGLRDKDAKMYIPRGHSQTNYYRNMFEQNSKYGTNTKNNFLLS